MLNYSLIGKQIKIARVQKDLSQEKLAEMTGISTTHLSNIERGRKSARLETFVHIAKSLDISMDYLLCYEPNMPKQTQILKQSLSNELTDCSAKELIVLEEAIKQIKAAMRLAENN